MTVTSHRTVPADEILARPDVLPGQRDTPTRQERLGLLRAMRSNLDGWMIDFHHAAYHVPKALLDGRLTVEILDAYPTDHSYPEKLSKAIAHQAGMVFDGDDGADDAPTVSVGGEAVGIAIRSLLGLIEGDAEIHGGTWGFYPECLEHNGLTIRRVGELMRHYATDLTTAAQLLMAAWAIPLEDTY